MREDKRIIFDNKVSVSSKKLQAEFVKWAMAHGYAESLYNEMSRFLRECGGKYSIQYLGHLHSDLPDGRMRGFVGIGLRDADEDAKYRPDDANPEDDMP